MLRVAHFAALSNTPMIGINLGNLGFLTDVDKRHGIHALEKVLAHKYSTEKRIMLEAEFGADKIIPLCRRIALNEVNIGNHCVLEDFSIYVNEQRVSSFRADSIIVATPTGSTAYSLSAGGPILLHGGEMIVITPVCPHSLGARPWVIGADDSVRIVLKQASQVSIDGYYRGDVPRGQSVLIKKSEHFASIIKTTHVNFYNTLKKKKLM
jgi:NAD+ kinase